MIGAPVAAQVPEAAVLVQELLAFRMRISASGHDAYAADWREGTHDDLVLAVALACWWGERDVRPLDEATRQLLQGASFYHGGGGSDWGDDEDSAAGWAGRRVYG